MARSEAVNRAVRSAIESAQVDQDAARDERVRFDREALQRVADLYKSPTTQDQVIRAWREILSALINAHDLDRSLAAVVLQDRLKGVRDVTYEVVDGEWRRASQEALPPLDDPWTAERNW